MNKFRFAFFLSLFGCAVLHAQTPISVDDFTTRNTFYERDVSGIDRMNDGKFYTTLAENKVVRHDITTGRPVETLVDGSGLPAPLEIDGGETRHHLYAMMLTFIRRIFRKIPIFGAGVSRQRPGKMNGSTNGPGKKALVFAVLASVSFCASYILAPLGNFIVWIFGGTTVYLLFLTIYALVPPARTRPRNTRFNAREEETRAYIAFHKPILTGVFVAGALLVLFILLMVL